MGPTEFGRFSWACSRLLTGLRSARVLLVFLGPGGLLLMADGRSPGEQKNAVSLEASVCNCSLDFHLTPLIESAHTVKCSSLNYWFSTPNSPFYTLLYDAWSRTLKTVLLFCQMSPSWRLLIRILRGDLKAGEGDTLSHFASCSWLSFLREVSSL